MIKMIVFNKINDNLIVDTFKQLKTQYVRTEQSYTTRHTFIETNTAQYQLQPMTA